MPPKKTKAAATPSLANCSITFAASSIPADALGGRNLAKTKEEIASNGGEFVTKVAQATHLVVSEAQYNKSRAKVEEAKASSSISIVSFEWLDKSFFAKGPVDSTPHMLHTAKASTTNISPTTVNVTTNGTAVPKTAQSKKRKRTKDEVDKEDEDVAKIEQPLAKKTMNVTRNADLKIPLDKVFIDEQGHSYIVHIADDSTIYDVTLNQSDSGKNANKFYIMQLVKSSTGNEWFTWTRWGRVGEDGQRKLLGNGSFDNAMAEFKKKFKDKTGNTWDDRNGPIKSGKYAFIERSYEDSDSEGEDELLGAEKRKEQKKEVVEEEEDVQCKLPEPVQQLLKLIFNQEYFNNTLDSFNYDAKKMPLGKLSKNSLLRGYTVLKQLSQLVQGTGNAHQITNLSNQYLSLIPHVVSRNSRPPVISSMQMIKQEIELLEALTDMQLANDLMKDAKKNKEKAEEVSLLDRQFAGLGMNEMTPLETSSTEFKELSAYLTQSVGHTHRTRYKVQDIFRIKRNGEYDRFDTSSYAKISNKNRRLLWHGSRATNFGGILSQGLRIAPPEAPATGYMFGKGVYLADMSSKSANYCSSHSSGGTGLLLLCEAELGEPPLKLVNADYDAGTRAKEKNLHSTWGVGRTAPLSWKDAGCVHSSLEGVSMPDVVSMAPGDSKEPGAYLQYNEFIVYDVAQIKLRYLFRVSM